MLLMVLLVNVTLGNIKYITVENRVFKMKFNTVKFARYNNLPNCDKQLQLHSCVSSL